MYSHGCWKLLILPCVKQTTLILFSCGVNSLKQDASLCMFKVARQGGMAYWMCVVLRAVERKLKVSLCMKGGGRHFPPGQRGLLLPRGQLDRHGAAAKLMGKPTGERALAFVICS